MEIWKRNIGLIRVGGGDFFNPSIYYCLTHFLSRDFFSGPIREEPVTVSNVLITSSASASLSRLCGHTRCEEDDFIVVAIDLGGAAAAVVVASVASGFEAGHGFEAAAKKKEQEHECTDPDQ